MRYVNWREGGKEWLSVRIERRCLDATYMDVYTVNREYPFLPCDQHRHLSINGVFLCTKISPFCEEGWEKETCLVRCSIIQRRGILLLGSF
jgi:hypothetical protein